MRSIKMGLLTIAMSISIAAGCTTEDRAQVETAAANTLLPPAEEKQLGQQVHQQIAQQSRFVEDDAVNRYVRDICARLFRVAKTERQGLAVDVYVIDDPKIVNAFATPGEQLYVYSGLLLAADSDAEIAGVLGHETGHIVARHPARQMVNAYGLDALTSLVLGKNAPLAASIAASVASKGYLLANSRADETEADEYGARFASGAGYDPNALAQFLTKISAKSKEPSGVLAWLSDHPTTPDRVQHLQSYITQHQLSGATGGNGIAAVKERLGGRPAPQSAR